MKFSFDLHIGDRVIRIEEEVADEHVFFQRMAFWDSLPTAGPNGEADLRFSYRTPKGYEYYAIECRSAGEQFDFGQLNKPSKDLFPKTWSRIQHGLREERDEWEGPAGSSPVAGEPPAAPAPPPAPAPPVRTASGNQNRLALDGVIAELTQYEGAGKVASQIQIWAKDRKLDELTERELKQVLDNANGWLLASKKKHSRYAA